MAFGVPIDAGNGTGLVAEEKWFVEVRHVWIAKPVSNKSRIHQLVQVKYLSKYITGE